MTTEERVLRLENAFATLAEMVANEKTRTDLLLQLVRDHEERSETHGSWINQLGTAQAESERKIAALVDAQIRTEESLSRLSVTVERLVDERSNGQ
jgi:hypothetical protein